MHSAERAGKGIGKGAGGKAFVAGTDISQFTQFKGAEDGLQYERDGDKRAAYDRFGHAGVKGGAGANYGGFSFSDALEIFMRDFGGFGVEDLFGGGRQRRGPSVRKGPDMRVNVSLTLDEVASGVKRTLRMDVMDACAGCAGSGAAPGTSPVTCSTCSGAGEVRRVQRSFIGQLVSVMPCPDCGGEGQRVEKACEQCGGRGVERASREIEVSIPPGVSTGDYLTLRGQGNAHGTQPACQQRADHHRERVYLPRNAAGCERHTTAVRR